MANAFTLLDSSVGGSRYSMASSPSLAHLVRDAAKSIRHPTDEHRTLWDAREDRGHLFGTYDEESANMFELEHGVPAFLQVSQSVGPRDYKEELAELVSGVGALGSGSDFTVFLQRLGVCSSCIFCINRVSDPYLMIGGQCSTGLWWNSVRPCVSLSFCL